MEMMIKAHELVEGDRLLDSPGTHERVVSAAGLAQAGYPNARVYVETDTTTYRLPGWLPVRVERERT